MWRPAMERRIFLKKVLALIAVSGLHVSVDANAQQFRILIRRVYKSSAHTIGELSINGEFICYTMELPWLDNHNYISSIPAGEYSAIVRYDKTPRWNGDEAVGRWRFELLGTQPERDQIQIHVGNYRDDTRGCVLLGMGVNLSENMLLWSQDAYKEFKQTFYGSETPIQTPNLDITVTIKEYAEPAKYKISGPEMGILHQQNTNWKYVDDNKNENSTNDLLELKRTPSYIYFQAKNGSIFNKKFLRWPQPGGVILGRNRSAEKWSNISYYTATRFFDSNYA
jgi:uncharacterized protein DUF5675